MRFKRKLRTNEYEGSFTRPCHALGSEQTLSRGCPSSESPLEGVLPSCQPPPGCPNPSAHDVGTLTSPHTPPMAGWNSRPGNPLDMECAGVPGGVKGKRVSQPQLPSQCPHWFHEHRCSLPPSLLAAGVGGGVSALDHGAVRVSRPFHCPVPACGLPLATGCPWPHSCSASSCSSWAAAGHGSSTPHAFASPTKVRGSSGSAPAWEGWESILQGAKGWSGLGETGSPVAVTSPHSGPSGCFRAAAPSTVPEDATPVLLPLEKEVGQRMPCPGPAEHWDQRDPSAHTHCEPLLVCPGLGLNCAPLGNVPCLQLKGTLSPRTVSPASSSASHQHSASIPAQPFCF